MRQLLEALEEEANREREAEEALRCKKKERLLLLLKRPLELVKKIVQQDVLVKQVVCSKS